MFDPRSLHKVWKWLSVCVNEATIDFHHVSAVKLRNTSRRNITQRWVSWSIPVVPEISVETKQGQRRVKKRTEASQTEVLFVFSTLPLFVFVCNVSTWEKSEMLTFKNELSNLLPKSPIRSLFFFIICLRLGSLCSVFSPNSDLGSKKFGNCWSGHSGVSSWNVYKIHECLNNKIQSTQKKSIFFILVTCVYR